MKMSSLFYINSENNLDHASPLIWFLLKKKKKVYLKISKDFNFEEDYRIKFFINFNNFKILKQKEYRESFFLFFFIKLMNFFIKRNYTYFKSNIYLSFFFKTVFHKVSKLNKLGLNFIFYSWGDFSHHIIPAKFLNIHSIALPHGFNAYLNQDISNSSYKEIKNKNLIFKTFSLHNLYDYYIVENQTSRTHALNIGINKNNIKLWGSLRYSKKWIKCNYRILKRQLTHLNKKKILFIFPHWSYKVDVDKTFILVEEIVKKFPNQVTIKPHIRIKFTRYDFKARNFINKFKKKYNLKIASNVKTPELILSHDIIIGFGTSILIDALYLNKKLIIPDYLQKNKTIYTYFKLPNVTKNLKECINKIKKNNFRSNNSKELKNLNENFIFHLNKKKDVLDNYIHELQTINKPSK